MGGKDGRDLGKVFFSVALGGRKCLAHIPERGMTVKGDRKTSATSIFPELAKTGNCKWSHFVKKEWAKGVGGGGGGGEDRLVKKGEYQDGGKKWFGASGDPLQSCLWGRRRKGARGNSDN